MNKIKAGDVAVVAVAVEEAVIGTIGIETTADVTIAMLATIVVVEATLVEEEVLVATVVVVVLLLVVVVVLLGSAAQQEVREVSTTGKDRRHRRLGNGLVFS